MRNQIKTISVLIALFNVLFFWNSRAFCAEPSQARVSELTGSAQYQKAGTTDWLKLGMNTLLSEGDTVRTGKGSQVKLELTGNAKTGEVIVKEDSQFTFKTFQHDAPNQIDNTQLDVDIGDVLIKAEKLVGDSKFEVNTPTSIVGIRGTTFEVKVSKTSD